MNAPDATWPVLALDTEDGVTVTLFRDALSLLGWLAMDATDGVRTGVLDVYQADGHRLVPALDGPAGQHRVRLVPDERGPRLQELCNLLTAAFWRAGQPLTVQAVGHPLVLEAMSRALLP